MSTGEKKQLGRITLQQRARTSQDGYADRPVEDDTAQLRALSARFGVPGVDLRRICIRLDDLEHLPREIARKHVILPILVQGDRLFVAMANPTDKKVIDELEFVTDRKVYPYAAIPERLSELIEEAYVLRARGAGYYIGPDCPPEVLEKAGLSQDGTSAEGAPASDVRPEPLPGAPAGFVSDAPAPPSSEMITDDDFGNLSKEEVSVVSDFDPELPRAKEGKRILIVDDEPEIRQLLERLLDKRGYSVTSVDNGRAALRIVKEQTPDLIVLDAMLPEVHGFEIARRIKGSERYKHIPIVMVSAVYRGWRYAEDLRESCGVEHYVEKPFKIADVVRAVEQALASEDEPSSSRTREISAEAEQELSQGVAAYQKGDIEEAVAHLRRGIEIDPLAYRLHFHLGLLYGKKGQVYEAIGELERAVEINSKHFPAVKNLAILYQKAGFRNKANEMWERALNVAPDHATRQSIKEHLLSLL